MVSVKVRINLEIQNIKKNLASPPTEKDPPHFKKEWPSMKQETEKQLKQLKERQQLLQDNMSDDDDDESMGGTEQIPENTWENFQI